MKRAIIPSVVLLVWMSGEATAACSDPQIEGADLTDLVAGNTVCASAGGDVWQEQHRTGGALWDYKKGSSDPVDPTAQVGTWSITANDTITYSYSGGASYTYTIHGPAGGPYSFCAGGSEVVGGAVFYSGNTGCP